MNINLILIRKVVKLENENRELLNKVLGMKTEMADKINEATEIYQKGLDMMKEKNESPIVAMFTKDVTKLEDYMVNAAVAPAKSSVSPISSIPLDPREAEV